MNLFERAKNIRIKGESWQNSVQRAKAQLKYEQQLAGSASSVSDAQSSYISQKAGSSSSSRSSSRSSSSQVAGSSSSFSVSSSDFEPSNTKHLFNSRGGYFKNSSVLSDISSTKTSDFTNVSDTTSYTLTGGSVSDIASNNISRSYTFSGGSDVSYTTDDNVSVSSIW